MSHPSPCSHTLRQHVPTDLVVARPTPEQHKILTLAPLVAPRTLIVVELQVLQTDGTILPFLLLLLLPALIVYA
jgi:hypothetical protein